MEVVSTHWCRLGICYRLSCNMFSKGTLPFTFMKHLKELMQEKGTESSIKFSVWSVKITFMDPLIIPMVFICFSYGEKAHNKEFSHEIQNLKPLLSLGNITGNLASYGKNSAHFSRPLHLINPSLPNSGERLAIFLLVETASSLKSFTFLFEVFFLWQHDFVNFCICHFLRT